ncbi:unnamed protein product [Protopolystoma xenopodis]|uniref:Uncharacterized protein n=1 Tax=Protopolystoma xenopodis TaxID=117903 RepID=A0A448XH82_9PLAT|nr:unnamed protein product [Protopolystoma xenopodis]
MLEPMLSLSLSIGASDPSLHKRHTLESFPDAQIQSQLTSHGGGRIQQSLDTCISSFTKPTSNDPPSNSPLVDGSTLDHPCSFNTSLPDVGVDLDFAPVEREAGRTAGMVSLSTLFDDEDNNDDDVGHNDDRAGDKDRRRIYMPELGACCLARSYLRSRSARVSRQTEWPLGQKAAHEWSFFPVLFVDQPNATALGASGCQINSRRPTRINFSGCRRHPEALYSSVWMLRAVSVGALKLACGEEESNQMCKSRANGDLRSEIYCDMQKRKDCNLTSWGAAMWSGGPHSQLSCYSRQSHLYRPSDNKVKSHEIFATGIRKTRKKASVKSTLPVDSEWSSSWPVNWETTVASLGNGGEGLVVGRKMSLGDTLELKENVFREKTVVKDGKSPSAQYPQHRQEVDNKKQQTDNLRIKQRKSRGLLTQPLEIATRFVRKFLMPKSKKGSAKRSELNISTYVESGSLCPVVISEVSHLHLLF